MDERASLTFREVIENATQFDREAYARNYGGILDDISTLLHSDTVASTLNKAREQIESGSDLEGYPRLQTFNFGIIEDAPELMAGEVAAVDGTNLLPLRKFSAGQAIAVGVGSMTYQRNVESSLHGFCTSSILEDAEDMSLTDYIHAAEQGLVSINTSAYLRYFEAKHSLEINEEIIFSDGPMAEWLLNQDIGRKIYLDLYSTKKVIGIIKDLQNNIRYQYLGRALKTGELFLTETLYRHMERRVQQRERVGQEGRIQWRNDRDFVTLAKQVCRGVFKPNAKAFGFECQLDHLPLLLRVMAADCQMNKRGHEIPFLLNEIDAQIRAQFARHQLDAHIEARLMRDSQSEELFWSEKHERELR
jgi:hypothetical protein